MLYLSQMMGKPVVDATGEKIGTISDLAISTGEVFPRITSLAFQGPGKVPFMISWRKYVEEFDEDGIRLSVPAHDIRFSYLQPEEILLARDLLNRQIVDTQGMKVVRVNDLKLSISGTQLRLLGAEVGARGILRGLAPWLERAVVAVAKVFGKKIDEQIIAWNYMDLLDRDLSEVQLSVTHKRLDELHPADVADILEQLDPQQRANVFQHLDDAQATEAISEMDDEYQADFIEDLDDARAAGLLGDMDPDDAADIVRDLSYEKAETLLRLMGVEDATEIRRLLGYKDGTAGGMMTTQFVAVKADNTVGETIEVLRELNGRGYGRDGRHVLDLVFNPQWPVLPPDQAELEAVYRRRLAALGVSFDHLFAVANNPIGRYGAHLIDAGAFDSYLNLLIDGFNQQACDGMMCRRQLSVGWDGRVYDCDFNQALGLPVRREDGGDRTVFDYAADPVLPLARPIRFRNHCYACTAGSGTIVQE